MSNGIEMEGIGDVIITDDRIGSYKIYFLRPLRGAEGNQIIRIYTLMAVITVSAYGLTVLLQETCNGSLYFS